MLQRQLYMYPAMAIHRHAPTPYYIKSIKTSIASKLRAHASIAWIALLKQHQAGSLQGASRNDYSSSATNAIRRGPSRTYDILLGECAIFLSPRNTISADDRASGSFDALIRVHVTVETESAYCHQSRDDREAIDCDDADNDQVDQQCLLNWRKHD